MVLPMSQAGTCLRLRLGRASEHGFSERITCACSTPRRGMRLWVTAAPEDSNSNGTSMRRSLGQKA